VHGHFLKRHCSQGQWQPYFLATWWFLVAASSQATRLNPSCLHFCCCRKRQAVCAFPVKLTSVYVFWITDHVFLGIMLMQPMVFFLNNSTRALLSTQHRTILMRLCIFFDFFVLHRGSAAWQRGCCVLWIFRQEGVYTVSLHP
jgi:hypothetical protein